MSRPLRALIVEDSEDDALLLLAELRKGGWDVDHVRVETDVDMRDALAGRAWDVVLSDYSMPRFSAPLALAVLKESGLDLPFLVISGTIGEETAVEALKNGANDFMVKGKLARLIPALDRELREVAARRARRRAEEAERASEERFRALAETASDAIVTADAGGAIVYVNPATERMFLRAAADLATQSFASLFAAREGRPRVDPEAPFAADGPLAAVRGAVELVGRRQDGSEFPIDLSWARWSASGGDYVTAILRDVGDRKRMEAQLLASDRMASVGTLAAGVAHEINNPLTSVLAYLDLAGRNADALVERLGESSALRELREDLHDAREGAERVRAIVRDLKVFSRAEEETSGPVDVERVVDSALRMAFNEIRHRAQLVKEFGGVPLVDGNESRLVQVILNLVVNAAHAIPEGRAGSNRIAIKTAVAADGRVDVEVRDTGCGMPPEVLRRLFTPFFTTKPVGVGTGLGLSICQRIVHSLGGEIVVESEVGRGSAFHVLLPATRAAIGGAQAAAFDDSETPPARRGNVLAIDDEPALLKVILRALGGQHDVTTTVEARDGVAAVARGERFDVILCDLMMPQMTGMDVHAELARIAPDQAERVVFLTGGAFTVRARLFLDQVQNPRIEKPFELSALRALVNDRVR